MGKFFFGGGGVVRSVEKHWYFGSLAAVYAKRLDESKWRLGWLSIIALLDEMAAIYRADRLLNTAA